MARVFVSHASSDIAATEMVHRWLVDDGHETFLDRHRATGIAPGDEWDKRLHERLRWADAMVCVLTSAYTTSSWCAAEVALARSRGALVVPVLVEPGVGHPLLADLQAIDATRGPQDARERLSERLAALYGSPLAAPDELAPYPGLVPFEADRHRLFFGREADVRRLADRLRSPAERADAALFLVVGPSGCGKSSLVRAGLLPTVAREPDQLSLAPIVPGQDPVGAVCLELAEVGTRRLRKPDWGVEQVRERVTARGLGQVLDELLLALPGPRRTRVILVVDQFEELLTRSHAAARAEFAALIGPALARSLQVIATLRPEFLDPLLASPELAELPKRIHTLEPMSREALRSVVEKPAEVAAIKLDDGLAEQLVADTGSGEALPLLAYTLAQLAEGVERGGRLTLARYAQLGGVQGTLVRQADEALGDAVRAAGRDRAAVIRSLMRLVHVDERGRPARIRVPRAELSPEALVELEPFLKRRLLVTATEVTGDRAVDDEGQVVVGVAHEAFLTAWPPLNDAVRRDPVAFRARRRLEEAARRWAAAGHHDRHLWSGSQLVSAAGDVGARLRRGRLSTDRAELDAESARFLRASMLRSRRLRQGLVAGLAVIALVMTVTGGIALWQRDRAEEQRRVAVARQLLTEADAARASDVRTALMLGVAAHHLDPGPEADANLLDTLTSTAYSRTLTGDAPVVPVAVSPDGLTLAEGRMDGRATLWDIADPLRPRRIGAPLAVQQGYVDDLEFSPSGRVLAAAGADRTVTLWDVTDLAAPRSLGAPLGGRADTVHAVAFSPDGRSLASVDFAGRLVVHDVTDPASPVVRSDVPTGHRGEVVDVAFAPDRPLLATAGLDHTVRLWDVTDEDRPTAVGGPLVGRGHPVWAVAFAPGGRVLASVDADGYLTQWDVGVPEEATPLGIPHRAHIGAAYALAYSRDGTRIATVGADRAVRQWSVTDPAAPRAVGGRLAGHTDQVYDVAYGRADATLVTGSFDRTTVLWDLDGANRPVPVGSPLARDTSPSYAVAISPDRRWLAVGGRGRSIAMWDVTDPGRAQPRADPVVQPGEVRALGFSPAAPVLAVGTADGRLTLWDTAGAGPPRPLGAVTVATGAVAALAFGPDGRRIVVAGHDRTVSLWDVTDPSGPTRIGEAATDHNGPVNAIAFAPDGRRLASGAADGSVLLWDVSGRAGPRWTATLVAGGSPQFAVAFSPNGRRLAAAGVDGSTLLFDLSPGEPSDRTPLPADGSPVYTLTFSPDSTLLVGGGGEGSISVWDVSDVRTARPLGQPMPAGIGSINMLAFAPGATWLAASGGSGSTAMWNLAGIPELRAQAVERACAAVGRGLSPQEWASRIEGLGYQDTCGSR